MTEGHPGEAVSLSASQLEAATFMVGIHDRLTAFFESIDGGGRFREDAWTREGGGGGTSRVLTNGVTFEKAGVNRSIVWGRLPDEAARRLGARVPEGTPLGFFAAGVSIVVHPGSPMVPTVHFNVRTFEVTDARDPSIVLDAWYGGGTDLTPSYPHPEDARHFHQSLHNACTPFGPECYPGFKRWCDEYFVNHHRGGEARGVGGIFYDHLRPDDPATGWSRSRLLALAEAVATGLEAGYAPIVERRRALPWGEREKHFQLLRRGRYVEFNLVHDRGTLFGLQTQARIESVLMSLPALAAWDYAPEFAPDSFEARFLAMLAPRDWLTGPLPGA